eukprot:888436_1
MTSLHSQEDLELVVLTILSQSSDLWQSDSSPYIGLKIKTGPIFQWHDGSNFDYVAPWTIGHPDTHKCVLQKTNSEWFDRSCTIERTFLCNECNGILNKYAVIPTFNGASGMTYTQAQQTCNERYGTNLASIHTSRDYNEAKELCDIFKNIDCWIGAQNDGTGNYEWDDGTEFDFFQDTDITDANG